MKTVFALDRAAQLSGLRPSQLRYWIQVGFFTPELREQGRYRYTLADLVTIRCAVDLLEYGIEMERARSLVGTIRQRLGSKGVPERDLCIACDGVTVSVARSQSRPSSSTPLVVDRRVGAILDMLQAPQSSEPRPEIPIRRRKAGAVQASKRTAYQHFLDGCIADSEGDSGLAETCFRAALEREPAFAAAHTNLGNLLYERGEIDEARGAFERALELSPDQAEARYNLANVLTDQGEPDAAIGEFRRVCAIAPEFADAHYNLARLLVQVGGRDQARRHLERYLELDAQGPWSNHSRQLLTLCA